MKISDLMRALQVEFDSAGDLDILPVVCVATQERMEGYCLECGYLHSSEVVEESMVSEYEGL